MYEIRFHGRGGQGAVLASKILAKAIPSFGFGQRGAKDRGLRVGVRKVLRYALPERVLSRGFLVPETFAIDTTSWIYLYFQSSTESTQKKLFFR